MVEDRANWDSSPLSGLLDGEEASGEEGEERNNNDSRAENTTSEVDCSDDPEALGGRCPGVSCYWNDDCIYDLCNASTETCATKSEADFNDDLDDAAAAVGAFLIIVFIVIPLCICIGVCSCVYCMFAHKCCFASAVRTADGKKKKKSKKGKKKDGSKSSSSSSSDEEKKKKKAQMAMQQPMQM